MTTQPPEGPTPEGFAESVSNVAADQTGMAVNFIVSKWLEAVASGVEVDLTTVTNGLARGIFEANDFAVRAADEAIVDLVRMRTGLEVPPLGLTVEPQDIDRLAAAVDSVFSADEKQIKFRMQRIANSEPRRAAKVGLQEAMRLRGVEEYVRVVQAGACDLCSDRVGEIRSIDVPFTDHPGCHCSLRARIPQNWGDEVKARAFQLRKVTPSGVRLSFGIGFENIEKKERVA